MNPATPLPGVYLKKPKMLIQKNICTLMYTAALFTLANIWKQPMSPAVDKWIRKLWHIYTIENYLALERKEILPFATAWMDLENIMLSEIITQL